MKTKAVILDNNPISIMGYLTEHPEMYEKICSKHFKDKRCPVCNKKMVHAKDNITGKISKYLYKYNCDCCKNKNLRLSIG